MKYAPHSAFFITAAPLAEGAANRLMWNMMGPLDEVSVGDYELHLIGSPLLEMPQLALQRNGKDFTDLRQQLEHSPSGLGKFDLTAAKAAINKWLTQYGGLIIATHDTSKLRAYKALLLKLGFRPTPDELMGTPILVIER